MVWHCIEERTNDPIGRIFRKLIFTEIYENEHYAKGKIAIPKESQLEVGKKVAYYEENGIRTGEFLCSSQTIKLSPMEIVNRMINTEEELKHFIKQNSIRAPGDCHLYGLVIHAYNYLRSKIQDVSDQEVAYDNTGTRSVSLPNTVACPSVTGTNGIPVVIQKNIQTIQKMKEEDVKDFEDSINASSPLSTNEDSSAKEAPISKSLDSPPTNALFRSAPKRISSPINKKELNSQGDRIEDVETISIADDDIKIELNGNDDNNDPDDELNTFNNDTEQTDTTINNGQMSFQMNLGPMNQAILQAQQNILQHQYNQMSQGHSSSINPYSSAISQAPKRSSINSFVENTGKRPRLDQPTIEVQLDNLSSIGKKEALMLTKEQIEMMLRINAPEVTLVQHIVRRPDLEKYWTYIRKINVNGHQTVWTQCTKCGEVVQFKNFEVLNPTGQNRSKSGFRTKQIYSHFNSCNDQTVSYPLALTTLENSKIELLKKLCQLQKTHPGI